VFTGVCELAEEIAMRNMKGWKLTGAALLFAGTLCACAVLKDPPGDKEITASVRAQLWQDGLPENSVYVSTSDHVVYLSGLVDTPLQGEDAATIAGQVPGVRKVVNSLVEEQ
jgi:hypothetical protein